MRAEKWVRKMGAEKFPTPATGILVNFERRWLGMMTKMKKMNVLIYQVTRFACDKNLTSVMSLLTFWFKKHIVASKASDLII